MNTLACLFRGLLWPSVLLPFAALLIAPAWAQAAQLRWVHGPGESTQCGAVPGYSTLHAALQGLDPNQQSLILVSRNYQHQVPAGPDPRVRITAAHAAEGGGVLVSGGKSCTASGAITAAFPGARSSIAAVNGGRIVLVDRASWVEFEDIEFTGALGAVGAVHPALHILGDGSNSTRVALRRVVVAGNTAGNNGAVIVGRARLDIEGARFIDNQGRDGAALLITSDSEVTIAGLPSSPEFATTRFENNQAMASGGAIQLRLDSGSIGPRLLLNGIGEGSAPGVLFVGNQAVAKGGAIELGRQADVEIIGNVRFQANSASEGGAISMNLDATVSSPRLRIVPDAMGLRPTFVGNQAGIHGGAIHCRPAEASARNLPAIATGPADFLDNRARLRGGALHLDGCRLSSIAGIGRLNFTGNEVWGGLADSGSDPQPRGGGALFVTRATATLGANGEFPSIFVLNRVLRFQGYWGHQCATQFCVLRGLSGGAVMIFDGAGHIHEGVFVGNSAPYGGAIAAVDASLTVDQAGSGCADPRGCSRFEGNRAIGAAYIESDASAGRARRGYGAAIAVRNDRADPVTGLHRNVRIQRSRFTGNGTGCTASMSCALDPERLLRGRVLQANVPDAGQLIVRGNLFAGNALADDAPTGSAQADDAEVSLYRRPPTSGSHRPVLLAANTFWKSDDCAGAPWLVDSRDSTGQAGRIDLAANLLLGCSGGRKVTAQAQTQFGVYACNISPTPPPAHALIEGHNQMHPATASFFADAASGDFRLSDGFYGSVATDVCGTNINGQSIVALLQSMATDLAGQPRPQAYGGGIAPLAGTWDVGAYERPTLLIDGIFAAGFE